MVDVLKPAAPARRTGADLLASLSVKFRMWNANAIRRRVLAPGEVLCEAGDYGATAFLMIRGRLKVVVPGGTDVTTRKRKNLLGGLRTLFRDRVEPAPAKGSFLLGPEDLIVGEMSCLNNYPRSTTMVADAEEVEVWEVRRNVLDQMLRTKGSRELLDAVYRDRVLRTELRKLPVIGPLANPDYDAEARPGVPQFLHRGLPEPFATAAVRYLQTRVDLMRVEPGQTIVRQGDTARDLFIVRLGFVKAAEELPGGRECVLSYIGPHGRANFFGEIGLLSGATDLLEGELPPGTAGGVRTATCSALDHVELVRVRGEDFRLLLGLQPGPQAEAAFWEEVKRAAAAAGTPTPTPGDWDAVRDGVRSAFAAWARGRLRDGSKAKSRAERPLGQYIKEGLFQGQEMLVLDLHRCTRCDECTKACADTHPDVAANTWMAQYLNPGQSRLLREGPRFDRFLVATSCRSCVDPYCMVGCPVDAIHRRKGDMQIEIDSNCIGCGLCATNCPYGSIQMIDLPGGQAARRRAITCDLCADLRDGQPSCVYACPHDAAFRVSGPELAEMAGASIGLDTRAGPA